MFRLGIISEIGEGENLGYARVSFDENEIVSGWLAGHPVYGYLQNEALDTGRGKCASAVFNGRELRAGRHCIGTLERYGHTTRLGWT